MDFKITEVDLSGVARGDPPQTSIKSINEAVAELDFIFTEMDLTEVARGEPASTRLKATELKLKSNKARAELDFDLTEVALSWSCTRRRRGQVD